MGDPHMTDSGFVVTIGPEDFATFAADHRGSSPHMPRDSVRVSSLTWKWLEAAQMELGFDSHADIASASLGFANRYFWERYEIDYNSWVEWYQDHLDAALSDATGTLPMRQYVVADRPHMDRWVGIPIPTDAENYLDITTEVLGVSRAEAQRLALYFAMYNYDQDVMHGSKWADAYGLAKRALLSAERIIEARKDGYTDS